MIRVCGFITFSSLYLNHKSVFAHQLDKGITPGHAFRCLKQMLDYQIQLDTAQPRIGLAKFSGFFDD